MYGLARVQVDVFSTGVAPNLNSRKHWRQVTVLDVVGRVIIAAIEPVAVRSVAMHAS